MVDFTFRPLRTPEEFRMVEDLQVRAWGMQGEHPVPISIQRALADNGGLVLGAFLDFRVVGFNLAFLGWDGRELFYHSHMNAVLPEYRNHRLGYRLKLYQREEVLKQGLQKIRWTFDPLQSRNARLNIHLLGARPDRYLVHYYGTLDSTTNAGLPTDRLHLTWELSSPEVQRRLEGPLSSPEEDLRRVHASQALLVTDLGDSGLRIPKEVREPPEAKEGSGTLHLEIPFDLDSIRQHEPRALLEWRQATREAFRAAGDLGWRVEDFVVVNLDRERRSFYLLEPSPPPESSGSSSGVPQG
jgi:predicted GNAT superfamily acetyltransferase